ncbi:MAG: MarR family transcriptional regulator [Ramlibacter sp.]|uniref:MarR family winged helix-turn-helix transcriptional regulator n=1 Tax=Ramlibacter sp. TaxID=1917967 RepID=UPI002613E013|nr:MarR family transcriptional regulator [Ramlibacter sp.]MDH4376953.1 MarR family transcriptional regulator [Ramlibacter sp.]
MTEPRNGSNADVTTSEGIDTQVIEAFLGYSARRASLVILANFVRRMAPLALRPVDFTVLALAGSNPGITSSQLCQLLDIQSPNLVVLIKQLQDRGLIERRPHPTDGRAMGLHLTASGQGLVDQATTLAHEADDEASGKLSAAERQTLARLLRKVYQ